MQVNGEPISLGGSVSLSEFLAENNYVENHVVVELNGEIVSRSTYSSTLLSDKDEVEILYFVGGGAASDPDDLIIGGKWFKSRFILGSGKVSLERMRAVIASAGAEIATLALRRANVGGPENILDFLPAHITLLPNTSGARNAEEAIRIARLARELTGGDLVKLEVIPETKYLLPDNFETVRATEVLAREGFIVLPYMYPDLIAARAMRDAGAAAIMPLAAPIGSNRGLLTREFIRILVEEIDLPIIVDAGIGRPSEACEAMEMGAAAIMANTAIATAGDIGLMAKAFASAIKAGRLAWRAGAGRRLAAGAEASSPLTGFLRD